MMQTGQTSSTFFFPYVEHDFGDFEILFLNILKASPKLEKINKKWTAE